MATLAIVEVSAVTCNYYACDEKAEKCATLKDKLITIHTCPSGKACKEVDGKATCYTPDPVTPACSNPGNKKLTGGSCCVSTAEKNGYCSGVALGGDCSDADKAKYCDVGLFCDGGKCAAVIATGSSCKDKPTGCQAGSTCYKEACTQIYNKKGDEACDFNAQCVTGACTASKCYKLPDLSKPTGWIDSDTDTTNLCEYSDGTKQTPGCIAGASDKTKVAKCRYYSKIDYSTTISYMTTLKKDACRPVDPTCDQGIDQFGCAKLKAAVQSNMAYEFELETVLVSCVSKTVQSTIDATYKCFGAELVWGLLTLLAIVALLI